MPSLLFLAMGTARVFTVGICFTSSVLSIKPYGRIICTGSNWQVTHANPQALLLPVGEGRDEGFKIYPSPQPSPLCPVGTQGEGSIQI